MTARDPVIIVGASVAGVSAADSLRAGGYDGPILLVDAQAALPYDKPPLSKAVLTEPKADEAAVALRPDGHYAVNAIDLLLGTPVTAIDARSRAVTFADGRTAVASAIVLATGARARRLEGGDAASVLTLRSWRDATRLRAELRKGGPLAIIGAGLIGLEVAAAARTLGIEVAIVEAGPRAMARLPAPELIDTLVARHVAQGVRFHYEARILGLSRGQTGTAVQLADGTSLEAQTVLAAIGAQADTRLAEAAGLACADGILTDSQMRTSIDGIYAIGDAAAPRDPVTGRHRRAEHWRSAQLQGEAAAAAITGAPIDWHDHGWCWSDQYGHRYEAAGHPSPTDRVVRRIKPDGATYFYLAGGRITGAATLDSPSDMRVALRLIERGIECSPTALADPATDLRKLVRAA